MKLPFVPSGLALALLAALAPVAVVVAAAAPGAWVVAPVLGALLLVATLLDGTFAGRIRDIRVAVPAQAEIGQPFALTVLAELAGKPFRTPEAAVQLHPRLAHGGRVDLTLERDAAGVWSGTAMPVPDRRGIGMVEGIWLRLPGPLRLAYRQRHVALADEIRVRPDLSPVRSPALQNFLRDAQFGLIARRVRGEGTQFEALREYEPGMDRRAIDWKASARHSKLYARENESERNNQIVFAFDCGKAMCEPVDGLPRIDRAVSAALTCAYVALKGGDRVALFGFARQVQVATPFLADPRQFHRLQTEAAALDYTRAEPNFTLGLASLSARLQRRSLVVLFSDFTDPAGAEMMIESVARLTGKHLVLFVTMVDSELEEMVAAPPDSMDALSHAVAADTLARQRELVLGRLRQMGVDVIEAPWDRIGYRLIDRYLDIKRQGAIG